MNRIAVAELTSEAFAPFGEVGAPHADGGRAPVDVALDLSRGTPRFCVVRLAHRGLVFVDTSPRGTRFTVILPKSHVPSGVLREPTDQ